MENEINYNEIITKLETVSTDGFEIPAIVTAFCLYGIVMSLQGIFMPEFVAINELIGR